MATYYISTDTVSSGAYNGAADTNTGTDTNNPWFTVAKVNGSSFSAGDSIKFNKGDTWREELHTPSAGSSGSPITFKSYGSGNDPIISGADLVTTWTEQTDAIDTGLDTDNSASPYSDVWYRTIIPSSTMGHNANRIRVKFEAHSSTNLVIVGASVGVRSGSTPDYSVAPTRITFDSGNNGKTISGGGTAWSDWITYSWDDSVDHLIHVNQDDVSSTVANKKKDGGTYTCYYNVNQGDQTMVQDVTGSSAASCYALGEVETKVNNCWQASLASSPGDVVVFDTTMGQEETAIENLTAANEWFWNSNLLYVYATSDPDSGYTSPGIQAAQRNEAIVVDESYITLDGLNIQGGDDFGVLMYNSGGGSPTNLVVQNCTIKLNKKGITQFSTAGAYFTVDNCTIEYNYGSGIEMENGCGYYQTITDNTIRYNGQATGSGFNTESGITGFIDHSTISGNTVHENCNSVTKGQGHGIYLQGSTSSTDNNIYDNTVYSNGNGNGFKIGNTTVNVYRNKSYSNYAAGIVIGTGGAQTVTCKVYYNLCYSNRFGFHQSGTGAGSTDLQVYNNTFYINDNNTGGTPYEINIEEDMNDYGSLNMRNNAVHGDNSNYEWYMVAQTGATIDYNCTRYADIYYNGASRTWSYWQTTAGFDANGLNDDPKMTDPANDDFTLQNTSSCIGKGINVNLVRDYAGTQVPSGHVDIGAYENKAKQGWEHSAGF